MFRWLDGMQVFYIDIYSMTCGMIYVRFLSFKFWVFKLEVAGELSINDQRLYVDELLQLNQI